MKEFEEYFNGQFNTDLKQWFEVSPFGGRSSRTPSCMMIDACSGTNRPEKCSDTPLHCSFFNAAIYYVSLIPQVIAKVIGSMYAMYAFCRYMHWPTMNSGMGGHVSPNTFLSDARLDPNDAVAKNIVREEVEFFKKLTVDALSKACRNKKNKALIYPTDNCSPLIIDQICDAIERESVRYGEVNDVFYIPEDIRCHQQ